MCVFVCVCAQSFHLCVQDRHTQTNRHLSECSWASWRSGDNGRVLVLSVKLGRQWFQWIGEERFLISFPSLSLPPLSLISVLISVTISSCPTPRTLSTPSYRLTQIQQCAFSSPLHVGAPVCMCELCALSPLCVDRLPCELQMGFTNTYQEWLSASYRVKNNIAGAKNRPFRKPFEMHGVSAASSISPLLSAIYLPPRAAHVLWHGGGYWAR